MKTPFKILPTEGYINSEFQIISEHNNLEIEILLNNQIIKKITANAGASTLLKGFKTAGNYIARAVVQDQKFVEQIKIRDAYKLGSSIVNKAFVFDESEISFLSMKDRLMIHNSGNNLLVTENLYNPTDIYFLKAGLFLFATRMENTDYSGINLGIYDTESFKMVAELTGNFQELYFDEARKIIWLHDKNNKSISCYRFLQNDHTGFIKVKTFENVVNFKLNKAEKNLLVEALDQIHIQNLENLSVSKSVGKTANIAVGFSGFFFEKNGAQLIATKINDPEIYKGYLQDNTVSFRAVDFFYVGEELLFKSKADELKMQIEELSKKFIGTIDSDKHYYEHKLSEEETITRSETSYMAYPVKSGFLFVEREVKNIIRKLEFTKRESGWMNSTSFIDVPQTSLYFVTTNKINEIVGKNENFKIYYENPNSIVIAKGSEVGIFYYGNYNKLDANELFESWLPNQNNYFLTKKNNTTILRNADRAGNIVFSAEKILNPQTIKQTGKIWFVKKNTNSTLQTNEVAYFDLELGLEFPFNPTNPEFRFDPAITRFEKNYGIARNNFVFSALTGNLLAPFVGILQGISEKLTKIVILREKKLYLGLFNTAEKSYDLQELPVQFEKYEESFMSPNGNFLVLKKEAGKFEYFDLDKNETVNFFSGNFLRFSPEGNLIFEQDNTRKARIIDPVTLQDVTPSNYQYYKFTSPDGKLHASVSTITKYFNRVTEKYYSIQEYVQFSQYFQDLSRMDNGPEKDRLINRNKNFLKNFLNQNKEKFEKSNITKIEQLYLNNIVEIQKYIVIGSDDNSFSAEIFLPPTIEYYNYAAFSHDNRYFGYVGKTMGSGILAIHKLNFNKDDVNAKTSEDFYSFRTSKAAWLCGFSKNNQFATYDSLPVTYTFGLPDENFDLVNDSVQPVYAGRAKNFRVIKGKNFLCYSPTGKYMGMSEQGYNPVSLGGDGHQISNAVHIADSETGTIVRSFKDHGDEIKYDKYKKVSYVFFSEDEKRIMSLSSDGVVVIRNIHEDFSLSSTEFDKGKSSEAKESNISENYSSVSASPALTEKKIM